MALPGEVQMLADARREQRNPGAVSGGSGVFAAKLGSEVLKFPQHLRRAGNLPELRPGFRLYTVRALTRCYVSRDKRAVRAQFQLSGKNQKQRRLSVVYGYRTYLAWVLGEPKALDFGLTEGRYSGCF